MWDLLEGITLNIPKYVSVWARRYNVHRMYTELQLEFQRRRSDKLRCYCGGACILLLYLVSMYGALVIEPWIQTLDTPTILCFVVVGSISVSIGISLVYFAFDRVLFGRDS